MSRVDRITGYVKRYDRELYCTQSSEGKLLIMRNSRAFDSYELEEGVTLTVSRPAPFFVCALTDNWKLSGTPREWGYFPIMERLALMDLWRRDIAAEQEKRSNEVDKQNERAQHNKVKDYMYEEHARFKKDFSDIRTCNMDTKEKRRKTKWEL